MKSVLESLGQDLRYGLRSLLKRPGFTAVAVVTLALGIGANTVIFSIVNAVLLQPLSYREPDRIVQCGAVTTTEFAFWKENNQSFEETAGYAGISSGFNLSGGAEPQRVQGLRVSEGFLRVLGVSPMLGRGFSAEEDRPNGPRVALISDRLWRNYFGSDPDVVGRQAVLNGAGCEIVGVLPPSFRFEVPVDLLLPLQLQANPKDTGNNTGMLARLRPTVTIQQAQAEMDQLQQQFRSQYPAHIRPGDRIVSLVPYKESVVGDVTRVLLPLSVAVGFVLLIACANLANLLLARSAARRAEMAIRVSLGATRRRLVRQLLTESALLALAGGLAGLMVSAWCLPALLAMSPKGLPRLDEIDVNYQVALFAVGLSFLTTLLFGIVPALRATQVDVSESLKSSAGRQGTGRFDLRTRGLLIVAEVGLSFVLLAGAGLLIQTFLNLRGVSLGFDSNNLTTMQLSMTSDRYQNTAKVWEFERQVLDRILASPGVASAATVSSLPMERGLRSGISIVSRAEEIKQSIQIRAISPDYFRVMKIPLLGGRGFTEADTRESAPVVIINEALAREYWPGLDPLEDQVSAFGGQKRRIVGVAGDIKEMGLDQPVAPTMYLPVPQMPDGLAVMMHRWFLTSWVIRTDGRVDLSAALREAVREVDPQMPVATIRPMGEVIGASIALQRFLMLLMGCFAGLALTLTAVGLYGVLSYQVSQRTHEIGIRMAMGAQEGDIFKLVVGQGMMLVLVGVMIGLAGALAMTRLISSLLYDVSATDPLTLAIISLVLAGIALLACYIPARRATKVNPVVALRYE
jgi:putative ABC transport system permease protein